MNVSEYDGQIYEIVIYVHLMREQDSHFGKIRLDFVSSRDFIGGEWKRVAHARYADAISATTVPIMYLF